MQEEIVETIFWGNPKIPVPLAKPISSNWDKVYCFSPQVLGHIASELAKKQCPKFT